MADITHEQFLAFKRLFSTSLNFLASLIASFWLGIAIDFNTGHPGYAVFIRVEVGDQLYESPPFAKNVPVSWETDLCVCSLFSVCRPPYQQEFRYVSSASRVDIGVCRLQTASRKVFTRKPYATLVVQLENNHVEDGSIRIFAGE